MTKDRPNTDLVSKWLKEKYANEDEMIRLGNEIWKFKCEKLRLSKENGLLDTKIRGEFGMVKPKSKGEE